MSGPKFKLKIRGSTPSPDRVEAMKRGDILHRALSLLETTGCEDWEKLVRRAIILEGESPRAWDTGELAAILESMFIEHGEMLVPEGARVFREQPILLPPETGNERVAIPDLVVVKENQAVVVDYKSKKPESEDTLNAYRNQVNLYLEVVKEAFGVKEAEGYLLFLTPEPLLEKV